jgi:hypothetical protein
VLQWAVSFSCKQLPYILQEQSYDLTMVRRLYHAMYKAVHGIRPACSWFSCSLVTWTSLSWRPRSHDSCEYQGPHLLGLHVLACDH